jgi:hypothetical protein
MKDYNVTTVASQNGCAMSSDDESETSDQVQKRLNPERNEPANRDAKRPRLTIEPVRGLSQVSEVLIKMFRNRKLFLSIFTPTHCLKDFISGFRFFNSSLNLNY